MCALLPAPVCASDSVSDKKEQHTPHFSSLFDVFKMLITTLLCAISNANVLFYCSEFSPTIAFAYLMSVSLPCCGAMKPASGTINNINRSIR